MQAPSLRAISKIAPPVPTEVEINAEQTLLGAILAGGIETYDEVCEKLKVDYFGHADHQRIYAAIVNAAQTASVLDAIVVADRVRGMVINGAPAHAYLVKLQQNATDPRIAGTYATMVVHAGLERELVMRLDEGKQILASPGTTEERIRAVQESIDSIQTPAMRESTSPLSQEIFNVFVDIEKRSERGDQLLGLSTSFHELDRFTLGLQGGDLVLVAGRPSMGKSTLGMQFAVHAAVHRGERALIFSIEMSKDQLAQRWLSEYSNVPFQRIRTGELEPGDWEHLRAAGKLLSQADVQMNDIAGVSIAELRSIARREHAKTRLGVIVVDYIQLMSGSTSGRKDSNRTAEMSEISRGLKLLARELDVPVVALSQLNRELERRPNKRPILADLRDSGSLEQDADLVLFVYRDEIYNEETPDRGVAEIIIGKQRNGPLGTVRLLFQGEYVRFREGAPSPLEAYSRHGASPFHSTSGGRIGSWYNRD